VKGDIGAPKVRGSGFEELVLAGDDGGGRRQFEAGDFEGVDEVAGLFGWEGYFEAGGVVGEFEGGGVAEEFDAFDFAVEALRGGSGGE
jgi:hypothetical protein